MNELPTPEVIMAVEPRLREVEESLMLMVKVNRAIQFTPNLQHLISEAERLMNGLVGDGASNPEIGHRVHHAVMLDYFIGKMKQA